MSFPRGRGSWSPALGSQRFRRRLGFDHNPLRRDSDRVQAWMRVVALVIVVFGVAAAALVARRTYADSIAVLRADAVHGYRTTGHVLSERLPAVYPDGAEVCGTIRVAWQDRAGHWHVRRLVVLNTPHRPSGTIPIFVNARGDPSTVVPNHRQAVAAAVITGLSAVTTAVGAAAVVYLLVLVPLVRRRMDEWQREWAVVEPSWRRQIL